MVSSTPQSHFTSGKDPVPILQEAGWSPGPVWTGGKSRPHRDSILDHPARGSVAIPTELPGPHIYTNFPFSKNRTGAPHMYRMENRKPLTFLYFKRSFTISSIKLCLIFWLHPIQSTLKSCVLCSPKFCRSS